MKTRVQTKQITLHIFTTNNYPNYTHITETYFNEAEAIERYNQLSEELWDQCNNGGLQDYQLQISDR